MNEYSKLDKFMQRAEKQYEEKIERLEQENKKLKSALKEIKVISDNYNLTVCKRREQIADIINEVNK